MEIGRGAPALRNFIRRHWLTLQFKREAFFECMHEIVTQVPKEFKYDTLLMFVELYAISLAAGPVPGWIPRLLGVATQNVLVGSPRRLDHEEVTPEIYRNLKWIPLLVKR